MDLVRQLYTAMWKWALGLGVIIGFVTVVATIPVWGPVYLIYKLGDMFHYDFIKYR